MQIELYYDFSKRSNSTKRPNRQDADTRDVVLKMPCSVDRPAFTLTRNKQLLTYDVRNIYVYVPMWDRYYFVDNIVYANNDFYELQCSSDVLATFKTEIQDYSCYVERSGIGNIMFNDPLVSPTQHVHFQDSRTTPTSLTYNNGCYGVRVAGAGDAGVITYIFQDLATLALVFDKTKYNLGASAEAWENMVGNYIFDPFDYVIDLFFIPISYNTLSSSSYTEDKRFRIKWFDLGVNARAVKRGVCFTFGAENINLPSNVYADFRKYNPSFSQYTISIPAVGIMPLDNNIIEGLDVKYAVNLETGSTKVWLQDTASGVEYASYNTNIFTHIQFASANVDLSSITGSVMNLVGSVMSGNPVASIASSVDAVTNIVNPPPTVVGSNGDIGLIYDTNIKVSLINYGSGDKPSGVCGIPTFKNYRLGSLNGYVKCGNASIAIIGFSGDRERVNAYLNGGFYIE